MLADVGISLPATALTVLMPTAWPPDIFMYVAKLQRLNEFLYDVPSYLTVHSVSFKFSLETGQSPLTAADLFNDVRKKQQVIQPANRMCVHPQPDRL